MRNQRAWAVVLAFVLWGCGGKTADQKATAQAPGGPPGAITIALTEEGFVPAQVTVAKDQPVTLVVTRKTDSTCAKEFVMPSQGINQPLPLDKPVTITFTPTESGSLHYACAMDMVTGTVIVK